jgi:hypothetical protein
MSHSLAILADGTVVAWEDKLFGQASPPFLRNVLMIGAAEPTVLPFSEPSLPLPTHFRTSRAIFDYSQTEHSEYGFPNLTGQGPAVITVSTNLMDWEPIYTNPPQRQFRICGSGERKSDSAGVSRG